MEKLHFAIQIKAPKEKVWETMLGKDSYTRWTEVFAKGSYYEGSWDKGSNIRFLAPDQDGKTAGMYSRIAENRPYEHVSIEHLGVLMDGKEITSGEEAEGWGGAHENYTLRENDGTTEVSVDLDAVEKYKDMFQDTWPKALQRLKEIAENK